MIKLLGLFLLSSFFVGRSYGAVEIAFIEVRNREGKIVQLEQDGRFAHVAISYQGRWLHAHPYYGVELTSSEALEKMGAVVKVLVSDRSEPTQEQVTKYVGKPYNAEFEWHAQGFYCSQLVAKILNIEPEPMKFYGDIWRGWTPGDLGISPDDLYHRLKARSHYRCESVFR